MSSWRRLVQIATATVAVVAAMAMAQPVVAQQRPAHPTPSTGNVIEVIGTSTGFTMRGSHPAGFVTFEVSTSHPDGGLFALWRLRPTASLDEALRYAMMGLSDTRSESVEGGRGLQQRAEVLGGAAVLPGQPVAFTSLLLPGSYYLVNYQDLWEGGVAQAAERLHALTITDRYSPAPPPSASATAVFTLAGGRASYRMPTELRSGQPLRLVNAMPQLSEAVFIPVRPGTTRQQLREFFAAADREDWDVDPPFTGDPVGVPALSPGHTTIIEAALPPGPYALVTWYPDFDSARMLAAEGQFKLVTIT